MKILFLAPQPFYQERGTPIAVKLTLETLSHDQNKKIDLLVYNEGQEISINRVNIIRIPKIKFLAGVRPGISIKKIIIDIIYFFTVLKIVWDKKKDQYDLIHAVEEAVFMAWIVKKLFKIKYVYDMDSSLANQVTENWSFLKPIHFLLAWFEKFAIKGALAVLPVCDSLAEIAKKNKAKKIVVLRDISLLGESAQKNNLLRNEIKATDDKIILLYVGNLENYQGIDLLIESFAKVTKDAVLVIIGGNKEHIEKYTLKSQNLNIKNKIYLLGPKPVNEIDTYLLGADILVSPRIKGNNTPMKVYSYLHSGVPVLATDLPTHTQVMDKNMAMLASPDINSFSQAMEELIENAELRIKLGKNAREHAEKFFTRSAYEKVINEFYDWVLGSLR